MFSATIDAGNLVQQLKDYAKKVSESADKGIEEAAEQIRFKTDWTYATSPGDTDTQTGPFGAEYSVVTEKTGEKSAEITADGDATFLEFGAGIHFNGSGHHPKQSELDISMGMYGKHQGLKDKWPVEHGWWSYGTPATQGMHDAYLQTKEKIPEIFREELRR